MCRTAHPENDLGDLLLRILQATVDAVAHFFASKASQLGVQRSGLDLDPQFSAGETGDAATLRAFGTQDFGERILMRGATAADLQLPHQSRDQIGGALGLAHEPLIGIKT